MNKKEIDPTDEQIDRAFKYAQENNKDLIQSIIDITIIDELLKLAKEPTNPE